MAVKTDGSFLDLARAKADGENVTEALIRARCGLAGRSREEFTRLSDLFTERKQLQEAIMGGGDLARVCKEREAAGRALTRSRFVADVGVRLHMLGDLGRKLLFDTDGVEINGNYEERVFRPTLAEHTRLASIVSRHEKASEQLPGLELQIAALS